MLREVMARRNPFFPNAQRFPYLLPIAGALGRQSAYFYLDLITGDVTFGYSDNPKKIQCHVQTDDGDGLLRWLETFAQRLENGTYSVAPLIARSPDRHFFLQR